jgi:hypothetical protein
LTYEARKLGVYTPMPTAHAKRVCPKLIVIPGDFAKYEHFSKMMFAYAYDFTPEVEVGSIDEGYFDLRAQNKKPTREIAETIRVAVAQSLKLSASFGIGTNKLVSQIASKLKKPACFIEVPHGDERGFLAPLANRWLPNIGLKIGATLDTAGLKQVAQIAQTSPDLLAYFVGSYAPQLWQFAQGIDERPIVPEHPEAKSYSEQETFGEDVTGGGFSHDEHDPAGPFLGDSLAVGQGFFALYQATGDRQWLDRAEATAHFISDKFSDEAGAGFVSSAQPMDPGYKPHPDRSENAQMVRFTALLAKYTGNVGDREMSAHAMRYKNVSAS